MNIIKTFFDSVHVIEPKIFEDNRGCFFESYQKEKLSALGIDCDFIQDNHSYSKEVGTIRGMHFQSPPNAQTKLIRVISGSIENFIIDIRKNSPTFLKFNSVHLSAENKLLLYIPVGFANGFKTLEKNCEIIYKVDSSYAPESDKSFAYNDNEIGIDWDVTSPVLSKRDQEALSFAEIGSDFEYRENS